jgi:hypothetical protein
MIRTNSQRALVEAVEYLIGIAIAGRVFAIGVEYSRHIFFKKLN